MNAGELVTKIELIAIAKPKEGETVDQLRVRLEELGHHIIAIQDGGIVVAQVTEELN